MALGSVRLAVVAVLLAVIILALAAPLDARRQDEGFSGDQIVTARYEGTEDDLTTGPYGSNTQHTEWDFRWTGPINELELVGANWTIAKLKATVTYTPPPGVIGAKSCAATLSPAPGLKIHIGGGRSPDRQDFSFTAQSPFSSLNFVSSDTSGSQCSGSHGGIYGGSPADQPRIDFHFGGPTSMSKRFDGQYVGRSKGSGAFKIRDIMRSTLSVAFGKVLPAPPGAPGPPGKFSTPQKTRDAALLQLRNEIAAAIAPCAYTGAGAFAFVGGGLFFGQVVGTVMLSVSTPFCVSIVQTIVALVNVIDDPPLPSYTKVALLLHSAAPKLKLPDCSKAPTASNRGKCVTLETRAVAYVSAAQGLRDIAKTLAITIGRESAAKAAGDKAALARQQKAAIALTPKLVSAGSRLSAAGRQLAAALHAVGATGKVTKEQSARGIAEILRRLGAKGIPAAKVRKLAGTTLTPLAFDAIATLG